MSLKARLKFNRPFAFDIAFLILAFLLTAIWPLRIISKPMIDIGGEWAEIHQSLFQATIVFAYLSLFIKKIITVVFGFLLPRDFFCRGIGFSIGCCSPCLLSRDFIN